MSATRRASCWALLALLCSVVPAHALDASKQLTQYAHRIWGQEEGLVQPTVYSIVQTRDGFLWLGTQDSLVRFDGVHFREIGSESAPILHGALVHSLSQDAAGNLWAGSIGSGGAEIRSDGSTVLFSTKTGFPTNNIFCLNPAPGGGITACTEKGLVTLTDGGHWSLQPGPGVRGTCVTPDGTRWIAGLDGGIYAAGVKRSDATEITALTCAADNSVWAGTAKGALHFTGSNSRLLTVRDGLPDNSIDAIQQSADGAIWLGSDTGLTRWRNGELSVYTTRDGLSHSVVLSMFMDREGSLWAGTKDGLDQFTDAKLTPYTTSEGLSSNETGPVLEDGDGHLWVGSLDSGIDIFDGHHFRHITQHEGLASDTVLALALEPNGDVLAGTPNGVTRFHNGTAVTTFGRGIEVHGIQVSSGGLVLYSSGNVYLAHNGTVEHLSGAALHDFQWPANLGRPVHCSLPAADGGQWLGTLGAGLVYVNQNLTAHARVKDGMWDNRIYAILRDRHGNLWFASSKGIFSVSEQQLLRFVHGQEKSLTSAPFTTGQLRFECRAGVEPAAIESRDGRFWFATTSGVVVLDPNHLPGNQIPPPVSLTGVFVDGARLDSAANLKLQPWQKNLEIHYAGLSFVMPEKVAFRYQLEGYDHAWVDAGTRRAAFYTNLPPGSFHLRVSARNADGFWSSPATLVSFSVQPHVYQRWWFFPALVLLAGTLSFALYRRRVRRIETGYRTVLAERSRIARELHDTLLQGLSGVTMQLQALWMRMPVGRDRQVLGEIIRDAGQCSTEARQSLWGLRAGIGEPASFDQRLAAACREALRGSGMQLRINAEAVDLSAYPEVEYQLLRISQEAAVNAVRHSGADMLEIALKHSGTVIAMTVADSGSGFDPHTSYRETGHFGLLGMRERAAAIGAKLDISSDEGGTRISVHVPLGRREVA